MTQQDELTQSQKLGTGWSYYQYDARGNCLTMLAPDGTTYYTYNGRNLMTSLKYRDGVINYFYYDANDRHYAIHDSDGTTYFTHDRDGLCTLLERDISGSVTAEHIRGYAPTGGIGDRAGARITATGGTYFQYDTTDPTGNTHRITRPDNTIAGAFEYNAFGRLLRDELPPEGTKVGFSSPAYLRLKDDPDHRHWLTMTRSYDSWVGRFLQRDVMGGLRGDYQYAQNRATRFVDPTGLRITPDSNLHPRRIPLNNNLWMILAAFLRRRYGEEAPVAIGGWTTWHNWDGSPFYPPPVIRWTKEGCPPGTHRVVVKNPLRIRIRSFMHNRPSDAFPDLDALERHEQNRIDRIVLMDWQLSFYDSLTRVAQNRCSCCAPQFVKWIQASGAYVIASERHDQVLMSPVRSQEWRRTGMILALHRARRAEAWQKLVRCLARGEVRTFLMAIRPIFAVNGLPF